MSAEIASVIVALGEMALRFGRVNRITYHEDGRTPESDTDHTVMLTLVACALADRWYPDIPTGEIAELAACHDVPEVYAGDTPTLRALSADAKQAKKDREEASIERLHGEFGTALPWLTRTIRAYETKTSRAARLVWLIDKLLPKITHILNAVACPREQGVTREELTARYALQRDELMVHGYDFPEVMALRDALVDQVLAAFPTGDN